MIDGKLKYVDAKGYFVGRFSETDLANGIDKTAVNTAKIATGLKYTNTDVIQKCKNRSLLTFMYVTWQQCGSKERKSIYEKVNYITAPPAGGLSN